MKEIINFFMKQNVWSVGWQGATISILDNPESVLNAKENAKVTELLLAKLQKITTESFGIELDCGMDGVRNHVVNADSIAFLHDNDSILGFASSKIHLKDKVFYLHGVATAQGYKCRGAGSKLVRTLSDMASMERIAFTTQNPIMFCLLRSMCTKVYPQPELSEVPARLREIGKRLVTDRPGIMNPKTFVISGLYDKCLYDIISDSDDEPVNSWFESALEIKRNSTRNGFLFIGENGW